MSKSVLIRGGTVIDGTGGPPFKADVLVKWGRIAEVGNLQAVEADLVIEADGKAVCPGFIDTHTHSDLHLFG